MLALLGIMLAAAGLPTREQSVHPWEVAEPPTAETACQLHKMLPPQSPSDEP
eukprot:COSAG04_NODE_17614_length_464_cov_0.660274_1_plen_51_part_01